MQQSKKNNNLRILILTALMIALTFIAGNIIKIPTFNGFIQIGDCMVLVGAVLLGKKRGALSAGIGMAFVDIAGGYLFWAPLTFIIKACMAYFTALILEKNKNKKKFIIAFIIGGAINVFGYFLGNIIIGGLILKVVSGFLQSVLYASSYIIGDTLQSIMGIIIALILVPYMNKIRIKFNLS